MNLDTAYRSQICRAVAKLDAPRSRATVGKPPGMTGAVVYTISRSISDNERSNPENERSNPENKRSNPDNERSNPENERSNPENERSNPDKNQFETFLFTCTFHNKKHNP